MYFKIVIFLALDLLIFYKTGKSQFLSFPDSAEVFMPDIISTENAEVKAAFNQNGTRALWGGIDWIDGKKDTDIWQSDKIEGKWTKPVLVGFDTDANDFDPFFAPDDKSIYFFSNRSGGYGGDDIYRVSYNAQSGKYGKVENVGPSINTKGDEWAPITDAAGTYLYFATNGRGGFGKHDLFKIKLNQKKAKPVNLGSDINSADDDFDAAILPDGTLLFTSTRTDHETAELFYANPLGSKKVTKLPDILINAKKFWTFGPSISYQEPGYLYFSGHLSKNMGRTDIYRIRYETKKNSNSLE